MNGQVISIGVDLVDCRRIARAVERFGNRFTGRILADEERRDELTGTRLAAYIARQFAAKEAVSKVLGTGMRGGVHFRSILVARMETGAPVVSLVDGAAEAAKRRGIDHIHISLSDERDYAIAYAVGVTASG